MQSLHSLGIVEIPERLLLPLMGCGCDSIFARPWNLGSLLSGCPAILACGCTGLCVICECASFTTPYSEALMSVGLFLAKKTKISQRVLNFGTMPSCSFQNTGIGIAFVSL